MSQVKNEITWINTLKGICIILVVLNHSIITTLPSALEHLTAGYLSADIWIKFNLFISPLRMPAFFFVSGLLAANAINKNWPEVFTKRFRNLTYLYFIWAIIQWFFISLIISPLISMKVSAVENSAYADNIIDFFKFIITGKTSLWYLYALAGYFLLAKLLRKQKYPLIVTSIIVSYAASLGALPGWGLTSICQNVVYFVLGAFFSAELINFCEIKKSNMLLWGVLLIAGIINIKLGIIKNIFTCLLAIIALIIICRELNKKINLSWVNWLGKNTLQIYVIHRIFIEALSGLVLTAGVSYGLFESSRFSLMCTLFYPIIAVVLCIIGSLFIWHCINRGVGRVFFMHPSLLIHKKTL
ncbi:acyltransferase family protein [Serratia rubidaea]|uniref:acyltransferase family protein n=1 Tax=Serratia rubidaea TaxID=61652 RepID=UPI001BB055C8|nr:acyltransferase family protein [Serratia rubidaea]MBS0972703.1 acyltransferase family protein [Serratia rubidaea]